VWLGGCGVARGGWVGLSGRQALGFIDLFPLALHAELGILHLLGDLAELLAIQMLWWPLGINNFHPCVHNQESGQMVDMEDHPHEDQSVGLGDKKNSHDNLRIARMHFHAYHIDPKGSAVSSRLHEAFCRNSHYTKHNLSMLMVYRRKTKV